jgi:hypothetical protein
VGEKQIKLQMLNPNFAIVGALINLVGSASYISDTLRGKVKPNRVTWGLWAVSSFIAFAAEVKQGVGIQSIMTFMVGFSPLLIFIASFWNKKAYWKLGKFDLACGSFSVLALVLWYVTKVGNVAIIFSILADLSAGLPTLIKSYKFPETENYIEFATSFTSAILTLLTFNDWSFKNYGFPLYIFAYDLIAFSLIKFKLGKRMKPVSI